MIFELETDQYEKVKNMFRGLEYNLSIFAVINLQIKGKILVDDAHDLTSALLIGKEGIFLGGDLNNYNFFRALNQKFRNEGFQNVTGIDQVDYQVFYPTESSEEAVKILLESYHPMKEKRRYLELKADEFQLGSIDKSVIKINDDLLKGNTYDGLEDIREIIRENWRDYETFFQNGFGFVYIKDNKIASWCISDCVVHERAEIGVETEEEYRRRGYCKKTMTAALNYCKEQGIKTIGWHCFEDNTASYKLAKSMGFKQMRELSVYFGWYDPIVNDLINGNYYMKKEINYALAAKFYRSAFEFGYGYPWQYFNAAVALYKIGEMELAKKHYNLSKEKGFNLEEEVQNNFEYMNYVYSGEDLKQIEYELADR